MARLPANARAYHGQIVQKVGEQSVSFRVRVEAGTLPPAERHREHSAEAVSDRPLHGCRRRQSAGTADATAAENRLSAQHAGDRRTDTLNKLSSVNQPEDERRAGNYGDEYPGHSDLIAVEGQVAGGDRARIVLPAMQMEKVGEQQQEEEEEAEEEEEEEEEEEAGKYLRKKH